MSLALRLGGVKNFEAKKYFAEGTVWLKVLDGAQAKHNGKVDVGNTTDQVEIQHRGCVWIDMGPERRTPRKLHCAALCSA